VEEVGACASPHQLPRKEPRTKNKPDWSRAVIDFPYGRAARRGTKAFPARSTAARLGSEHHVLTDGRGIPLAVPLDWRRPWGDVT
jgi:hypothetical protein